MVYDLKMMKKFGVVILIAVCHFGLCVLIVPSTMFISRTMMSQQPEPSPAIHLLVSLTSMLHFPIISLSLYPRMWFPGNWIYIPIAMNSLLVAVGFYFLVIICRKILKQRNRT